MRCYLIHDSAVNVLADVPAIPAEDSDLIQSIEDLDQSRFPAARLAALCNALSGAEPVRRFRDRASATQRLWELLEGLPLTPLGKTSKQDVVIALLQRSTGATLDELMAATGWQRHSIRGVLSGVIRKKRGLTLTSARENDGRVYRVES